MNPCKSDPYYSIQNGLTQPREPSESEEGNETLQSKEMEEEALLIDTLLFKDKYDQYTFEPSANKPYTATVIGKGFSDSIKISLIGEKKEDLKYTEIALNCIKGICIANFQEGNYIFRVENNKKQYFEKQFTVIIANKRDLLPVKKRKINLNLYN